MFESNVPANQRYVQTCESQATDHIQMCTKVSCDSHITWIVVLSDSIPCGGVVSFFLPHVDPLSSILCQLQLHMMDVPLLHLHFPWSLMGRHMSARGAQGKTDNIGRAVLMGLWQGDLPHNLPSSYLIFFKSALESDNLNTVMYGLSIAYTCSFTDSHKAGETIWTCRET